MNAKTSVSTDTHERPYLAWAAAGTTVLMWASAFVGIRAVGDSFDPGALALGRQLVGTIALGVIVVIRGVELPRGKRELGLIAIYGVLWFGGYNVALNAGERHLDAGTAALLVNVGPVLLALSAGVFLGEGFARQLLVGGGIAFVGVTVISVGAGGDHEIDGIGIVLCLVAAVCYAAAVTLQKPVLRTVSALPATWLGCLAGTIACLPFTPGLWEQTADASAGSIVGLIYLGVGPTAVAFTTWAYALARTDAGKMGATTYLVPAIVIAMSAVALGELPPPLAFVGGGLCLVGVAVTRLRPRSRLPIRRRLA
ncbi:DMT family transporter [Solicola gregarius]|uniref:DMT family transporter n=1 Tax=Solicola gregarius TaxID=2908642 RepID=A0AA46YPK5_9ACTN|nr:DMT family transporter [Solicola gregarius]UYM07708.1 DMT family transporter [Solicola gregarius]